MARYTSATPKRAMKSGKSTFLRCLNLLERPTGGRVIFDGVDITSPGHAEEGHEAAVGLAGDELGGLGQIPEADHCHDGGLLASTPGHMSRKLYAGAS